MEEISDVRRRNRAMWSSGDWDGFSELVADVGPRLLARVGIEPGMRVLDVGTGSGGSVAIPAARLGAQVTGSDLTAAWFDHARRRAADAGVEVEWVEADAEDLPFADGSFDRVLSTFGHMFAPRHATAAAELVRVCAPGGIIAFATWPPDGYAGQLIGAIGSFLPAPPPFAQSPLLWGDELHVHGLLELLSLEFDHEVVAMPGRSVEEFVEHNEAAFGPVVTARAALGDRWPEARATLVDLVERSARPAGDGILIEADYLVTVARKPA
jgi:SAM-dependent methyltransferase